MSALATCASFLLAACPPSGQDLAQDPAKALELAIDQPDPVHRRSAAQRLAARQDVALERWLAVAAAFLPDRDDAFREPGAHVVRVPLQVLDQTEETELLVHVPRSLDPAKPCPLLLAFHGTGGRGEEVEPLWRATAEKLSMIVLAPSEAGKNEGYAFSERERQSALAALRWARRRFDVDEDRIFATGISRGGHLAWDLALRHPDLLAAIAPMIGGPRFQLSEGQNNLRFLENVRDLSIRDLQGSLDDRGLVANVRLAFERLDKLKAPDAKLIEFPEKGHDFDFGAVEWPDFFGSARRSPIPGRVVRLAARSDEARAFWVEITKLGKEVVEDVTPKVLASTWNGLDEDGRRELLEREVERKTARLEVKTTGTGRFAATSSGVVSFRLLLTSSMFDPSKPVQVLFGGKLVEKRVRPDATVLLEDFVERFDRSFLPVAAVEVR